MQHHISHLPFYGKKNYSVQDVEDQRLHSVLETANDAIITADSRGRILTWNKTASVIFGYSAEETIGKLLTIIIPDEYKKAHERGMERVNSGGEHHVIGKTAELSGQHKDGHLIPIELSLSTWVSDNERFFTGIIRDISERKKHEEQLRLQQQSLTEKARELKKLNRDIRLKNEQLQALSNKLAKYLSRQVYNSIFEGKRDVKIESYRKKLTVFFSDIHGFTELTDRVESETLTTVLNKYLTEMSKVALNYGGTIDKYIGDAIMIFFGDPETLGEKEDAIACVRMALDMKLKMQDLKKEWEELGIPSPLRARMGINTGFCTVGNFGSEERLDYTIVGGPVNLASRLESLAPVDEILISADTYALVKDVIECEAMDEVKVKGLAYPVKTYKVTGIVNMVKKKNMEIRADLHGFNLAINLDQLNYADKLHARNILENVLKKL